jgi:hypothetical protein
MSKQWEDEMPSFDRYDWEEMIRARTFVALRDTAAFHGLDWEPSEAALTDFRNIAKIMLHPRAFKGLERRVNGEVRKGEDEPLEAERDLFDRIRLDNPNPSHVPRRIRPVVLKRFAELTDQGSKAVTLTSLARDKLVPLGLIYEDRARDGSKVIYTPTEAMSALVEAINTDQNFDPAPFFARPEPRRRPGELKPFPWADDQEG